MRLVKSLPSLVLSLVMISTVFFPVRAMAACSESTFLGMPTWHKYLDGDVVPDQLTGAEACNVQINGVGDTWLIVAAIIEIMLRVAALVAVAFIIYGGVTYILSQSNPDKVSQSQKTVITSLVGLTIAVVASAAVSFVASRF